MRLATAALVGLSIIGACALKPIEVSAAPCSPAHSFAIGELLTAANMNANPQKFAQCFNNLDNTNIGAAGIFANQIIPTTVAQATFGGSQNYAFPAAVVANNGQFISPGLAQLCAGPSCVQKFYVDTGGNAVASGPIFANWNPNTGDADDLNWHTTVAGSASLSSSSNTLVNSVAAQVMMLTASNGNLLAFDAAGDLGLRGNVYFNGLLSTPGTMTFAPSRTAVASLDGNGNFVANYYSTSGGSRFADFSTITGNLQVNGTINAGAVSSPSVSSTNLSSSGLATLTTVAINSNIYRPGLGSYPYISGANGAGINPHIEEGVITMTGGSAIFGFKYGYSSTPACALSYWANGRLPATTFPLSYVANASGATIYGQDNASVAITCTGF